MSLCIKVTLFRWRAALVRRTFLVTNTSRGSSTIVKSIKTWSLLSKVLRLSHYCQNYWDSSTINQPNLLHNSCSCICTRPNCARKVRGIIIDMGQSNRRYGKIVCYIPYIIFFTFLIFCIFCIFCKFCIFCIICIFCIFCYKLSTALPTVTSCR